MRFYDVDEGRVRIDGVNVRDLAVHDVRRAVGIVFEDTLLFHDSVAANIAFADPDADREAVERAARLAGAHDFIMGLPEAYDTKLGERGFSLSGGQRQRIAIARAILADPRVLVLDDATSAVDPSKEHEIRSAMSTVMEGRTTIVIAHRPGTIALADTVVLLDGGRVVASGPHQELLDTEPRYREVLAAMEAEDDEQRTATDGTQLAAGPQHTGGGRLMHAMGAIAEEDKLDADEAKKVLRRAGRMALPVQEDDRRSIGVHRRVHPGNGARPGDPRVGDRQRHRAEGLRGPSQCGDLLHGAHRGRRTWRLASSTS